VAGLKWSAVELDHSRLEVKLTRVLTDAGKVEETTPKTAAGRRTLDLDASLVAILRAHRKAQLEEQLKAGEAWEGSGYVFTNELGGAYYPGYFSDAWERRVKALGLPRIRLHDARHSAATAMLSAGEPLKVVSEMLGHSSANVTLSTYSHALPGAAKAAGERLSGQLFGEAAGS